MSGVNDLGFWLHLNLKSTDFCHRNAIEQDSVLSANEVNYDSG